MYGKVDGRLKKHEKKLHYSFTPLPYQTIIISTALISNGSSSLSTGTNAPLSDVTFTKYSMLPIVAVFLPQLFLGWNLSDWQVYFGFGMSGMSHVAALAHSAKTGTMCVCLLGLQGGKGHLPIL